MPAKLNTIKRGNEVEIDSDAVASAESEVNTNNADTVAEQGVTSPEVFVDQSAFVPDESNIQEGNVRIRMREDYSCCIAMERYEFKKNKCYTVPKNVKRVLNRAGLLIPLS